MTDTEKKVDEKLYEKLSLAQKHTEKWKEFLNIYYGYFSKPPDDETHWIFRGQKTYGEYELATSLERAFREFEPDKSDGKGKRYTRFDLEKELLREFKRKAHNYTQDLPAEDDILEWLSLMRRYGAPTRLLDWTYSYFIAIYYALRDPWSDETKEYRAEAWALNARWFTNKTEELIRQKNAHYLQNHRELANALAEGRSRESRNLILKHLMKYPMPLVWNETPIGLNERITIQQGTFLLPGDLDKTFVENLNVFSKHLTNKSRAIMYRVQIKLDRTARNEVLRHLNAMNISSAVLFRGLSGFAESLRLQLAFPEKFGLTKHTDDC